MEYTNGFVKQLVNRPGQPWVGYVKDSQRRQKSKTLKTYVIKQGKRKGETAPVKTEDQAKIALGQWHAELEETAIRDADSIPQASTPVADYVDSYIDDIETAQSVERSSPRPP